MQPQPEARLRVTAGRPPAGLPVLLCSPTRAWVLPRPAALSLNVTCDGQSHCIAGLPDRPILTGEAAPLKERGWAGVPGTCVP